ncbi:glutamate receptor ionotropic, kainate glr-3-like [Toxorhynchites rutilus septentrionalis]|uniref:glutamate receptor ionotropic, kainate glr-3-like n=1 Tax=Toxorhynchites rutilus septentrionalis TaxID=329112 RepID=UPI00247AB21B|nr:glutamate receptor ionotropic, kainate glr-3-like [Toxorhynchites rutilus septentrionalis]
MHPIVLTIAFVSVGLIQPSDGFQLFNATASLIRSFQYPFKVTALTCWNDQRKLLFWMAMNMLESSKNAFQFTGENSHDLPWHDPDQQRNLLVVDAGCPGTKALLADANQLLFYRVKWIVVNTNNPKCDSFPDFLRTLQVLISSDLYYLCTTQDPGEIFVKQAYRFSLETGLIDEIVGSWKQGTLNISRTNAVSSVRRQNLHHFKLRASLVITHNETIHHLEDYRQKHIDTITKQNYFLTKYVAQYLNATVQFRYVNSWGYRNQETGRFNGMIGELQSDKAHLGGTALFLTADRIKEIDYLSMTTPTRAKFIFRSPKLSVTDNVFMLPFSKPVWMCILSFICLSATLLLIIISIEFRYTDIRYVEGVRLRLFDTFMNMVGASCQQGSYLEPKSLPSRCLILLSLIVLMFLYASYSANIVALIQSPSSKIRTLEDLLNSRLEAGAEDTVYNKYYFTHETEPIRKAIFERKMKNRDDAASSFIPLEKGVQKLRQGLYAFHVELGVCYKVISETFQEEEKCGLQEIEYLNIIDPYYAVQKNSSFREIIRLSLFKLREFGIQGREHSMLYTKKPHCSGGSSFVPVSIVDVWPALLLLAWGLGISAVLLVMEKVWLKAGKRVRIKDEVDAIFKW